LASYSKNDIFKMGKCVYKIGFNHKNVSCSRRLSKCYFENLLIFIKKSTCMTCEYVTCSCIIGVCWMACCIVILTLSLWPKLRQSKVCKLKKGSRHGINQVKWNTFSDKKWDMWESNDVIWWTSEQEWVGKHEHMEYSSTYFFMS
jgi:hypothetical protein